MYSHELANPPSDALTLDMKETDALVIGQQIAAGIQATDGKTAAFLNNFEMALPGGFQREIVDATGLHDTPFVREDVFGLHSERSIDATYRSYFEDVDRAVIETGAEDTLTELRDIYVTSSGLDRAAVREVISRVALKAYSNLRQKGYSHYDLWR